MNEVTKEGYSAIEQALRDEVIEPRVALKKFERRNTVELPIPDSAQERNEARAANQGATGAFARAQGIAHSPPSIDDVLSQRNGVHGDFTEDAALAQALKDLMRQTGIWRELGSFQKEALEHIATKIARILSGNPSHPDHWVDIQGYARLVEQRLK